MKLKVWCVGFTWILTLDFYISRQTKLSHFWLVRSLHTFSFTLCWRVRRGVSIGHTPDLYSRETSFNFLTYFPFIIRPLRDSALLLLLFLLILFCTVRMGRKKKSSGHFLQRRTRHPPPLCHVTRGRGCRTRWDLRVIWCCLSCLPHLHW